MRARFQVTTEMKSKRPLVAALAYAKAGVKVFATWGIDGSGNCECGRESCDEAGKHPIGTLFRHGHKNATTDPAVIRKVWRKHPNANVAIVPDDGLLVVDIDSPEAERAIEALGLPRTPGVKTNRGTHLYLENPEGLAFNRPEGVDVRQDGTGYVIAPPSRHMSGHRYRWLRDPMVAADLVLSKTAPKAAAKVNFATARETISEGSRNSRLASLAGLLRHAGYETNAIAAALVGVNDEICRPPLAHHEVHKIATSIGRYESPAREMFGTLADVEPEDISWLYRPYLPRGSVTMLEGDPGQGKSTFAMALAAVLTTGRKVPWSKDRPRGSVLIMSAEDDPAPVLRPRMERNGADLRRVRFAHEPFSLNENGIALLRFEIERSRPDLVVIDPIVSFLHVGADLNDAADMTQFLTRINRIAREFDCAILTVRHLRKLRDGSAIHQGLGSVALSGRVRSVLLFGPHPTDRSLRAAVHSKSNYAKEGPAIVMALVEKEEEQHALVEWLESDSAITASDLLTPNVQDVGRPPKEVYDAMEFLRSYLLDGPRDSRDVQLAAEARSITKATLRRAREALGVRIFRKGRHTMWALRGTDDSETKD
jgi:hypothetical protein